MRQTGKGLVRDSSDWTRVKEQIESGLWDVSGTIPHRRILDYNIAEKNWPVERYDYASFASSVRQLVNQLNLKTTLVSCLPSCAEYETMCRSICIQLYQNKVNLFEISTSVDTSEKDLF